MASWALKVRRDERSCVVQNKDTVLSRLFMTSISIMGRKNHALKRSIIIVTTYENLIYSYFNDN